MFKKFLIIIIALAFVAVGPYAAATVERGQECHFESLRAYGDINGTYVEIYAQSDDDEGSRVRVETKNPYFSCDEGLLDDDPLDVKPSAKRGEARFICDGVEVSAKCQADGEYSRYSVGRVWERTPDGYFYKSSRSRERSAECFVTIDGSEGYLNGELNYGKAACPW